MMNVSDSNCYAKSSSFDFEEFSAMEVDSWSNSSRTTISESCGVEMTNLGGPKDDGSIIKLFSQSIEMFGNTMAPWPTGKSIPEQVAGIFITNEETSPKDETVESRLEANKPQIQTKLRRSHSRIQRLSISRINEETFAEAQRIFNELEAIPIVTADRKELEKLGKVQHDFEDQKGARSRTSRLQTWLLSLYSRSNSFNGRNNRDEECGSSGFDRIPLKSILKKNNDSITSVGKDITLQVQKSAMMTEFEVEKITSTSNNMVIVDSKPKKVIKLRFDNEVSVCETFHKEDYSRQSLDYVARQLTPSLALAIKKELNALKQEMEVHEDSRHLTQFYLIK